MQNEHGKFVQDLPHIFQVSLVYKTQCTLCSHTKWPDSAGREAQNYLMQMC